MTLKRDSTNSVILRKGKKRRKRKQNEVSEELYFWCSVTPGEIASGCFSWWGEIRPLTLPRCSLMPQQRLPHLLDKWPNAHPGKVNPLVPPALQLLHFLDHPRGGISAAPIVQVQGLCAAGVQAPARMELKEPSCLTCCFRDSPPPASALFFKPALLMTYSSDVYHKP